VTADGKRSAQFEHTLLVSTMSFCLRGSILEAVYHADDFVVQERTNTARASAMLLILWV
jgi:hypothetical protein